jgi:DNA uptake protein ComE-like DNA-binding protein
LENPIEFSKQSRRAIIIFIALLLLIAFVPRILSSLLPNEKITFTEEEQKIINFTPKKRSYKSFNRRKREYKVPPAKFDPNAYTIKDWMYLGLTQKQAEAVIKFGKYGFKTNQQLAKVFVIPKEVFELLKDSTFYPTESQPYSFKENRPIPQEKKIARIELNSASEEELITIPGIGPFFASNITKQRDKLGGFIKYEQLTEVWKFSPEKLEEIKPYVNLDVSKIVKLNINTVTVEELKRHPYFSWNVANSIVKMRKQKGSFTSISELKESVLITEELFLKIKPYLTL